MSKIKNLTVFFSLKFSLSNLLIIFRRYTRPWSVQFWKNYFEKDWFLLLKFCRKSNGIRRRIRKFIEIHQNSVKTNIFLKASNVSTLSWRISRNRVVEDFRLINRFRSSKKPIKPLELRSPAFTRKLSIYGEHESSIDIFSGHSFLLVLP